MALGLWVWKVSSVGLESSEAAGVGGVGFHSGDEEEGKRRREQRRQAVPNQCGDF